MNYFEEINFCIGKTEHSLMFENFFWDEMCILEAFVFK